VHPLATTFIPQVISQTFMQQMDNPAKASHLLPDQLEMYVLQNCLM
jgi:hypothetical protein